MDTANFILSIYRKRDAVSENFVNYLIILLLNWPKYSGIHTVFFCTEKKKQQKKVQLDSNTLQHKHNSISCHGITSAMTGDWVVFVLQCVEEDNTNLVAWWWNLHLFLRYPEELLDEKETFPTALKREYTMFISEKQIYYLLISHMHSYTSPVRPYMFIQIFQLRTFYHQQFLD